jgi:hypothetical protein
VPRVRAIKRWDQWWLLDRGGVCTCGAWRDSRLLTEDNWPCWYCLGWDGTFVGPYDASEVSHV